MLPEEGKSQETSEVIETSGSTAEKLPADSWVDSQAPSPSAAVDELSSFIRVESALAILGFGSRWLLHIGGDPYDRQTGRYEYLGRRPYPLQKIYLHLEHFGGVSTYRVTVFVGTYYPDRIPPSGLNCLAGVDEIVDSVKGLMVKYGFNGYPWL
ncbi:MAG: hypothetical protein AAB848_01400, partial [Patescibacteria group bacterium]